jgi:hypothetical protein
MRMDVDAPRAVQRTIMKEGWILDRTLAMVVVLV